jgi:hypothetical protein
MKDILAERLLAKVMNWEPADISKERPILQALATYKYDEYTQFKPGMRFVESLALWLNQFETIEERKTAYEFIRTQLVFISNEEMEHLVTIAYPDYIKPFLIKQIAKQKKESEVYIKRIANTVEFKTILRQSLFLGLSDGARMDLFRRNNLEVSYEQVWQTYEISDEKAEDMLANLSLDLEKYLNRKPNDDENKFKTLFLIDDFSGSGLSYLRKENEEFAGKLNKIFTRICSSDDTLKSIVSDDLSVCILLYIATSQALSHLREYTQKWFEINQKQINCSVHAIQEISDETKVSDGSELMDILIKYFDETIIDNHIQKGRIEKPYLGFDECALPVILNHNTPNNSLPILWFDEPRKYRGLFPRVSRHRRKE